MRTIATILTSASLLLSSNAFAWSDKDGATHEIITDKAIKKFKLYSYLESNINIDGLSILIGEDEIDYSLRYGSKEENGPRRARHGEVQNHETTGNQRVIRDITYYIYFELDENGLWTLERM